MIIDVLPHYQDNVLNSL